MGTVAGGCNDAKRVSSLGSFVPSLLESETVTKASVSHDVSFATPPDAPVLQVKTRVSLFAGALAHGRPPYLRYCAQARRSPSREAGLAGQPVSPGGVFTLGVRGAALIL